VALLMATVALLMAAVALLMATVALLMALECRAGPRCLVSLNISVFCEFCQRHDNFDETRYFLLAVATIFR
jgi:hypothetical protein